MARISCLVLILLAALSAAEPDLDRELRGIFDRRCGECHGPELKKPKGKFGHLLDLPRLAGDPDYVVPGQPDESELYLVLIDEDPDLAMPPADSEGGPMSVEEIALVAAWIRALGSGHVMARVPMAPPEHAHPDPGTTAPPPVDTGPRSLAEAIGLGHVLILHFPIALILTALLSECWGLARRRAADQLPITRFITVLGALGSFAGVVTGWWAAEVLGYRDSTVFAHRWFAIGGMAAAILAALVYEIHRRRGTPALRWTGLALLAGAAVLVAIAAHEGGELVHDRTLF